MIEEKFGKQTEGKKTYTVMDQYFCFFTLILFSKKYQK